MTLRKLFTTLLLLAASFATFAQSADLADSNNLPPYSSKSDEKSDKKTTKKSTKKLVKTTKSPIKMTVDTTKKTAVATSKPSQSRAATPAKVAVDSAKKVTVTPVKTVVDSAKKVAVAPSKMAVKTAVDSVKKTAVAPAKTTVKTTVDSTKKIAETPSKSVNKTTVDSTKTAVMSASKSAIPSIFGGPVNSKATVPVAPKKQVSKSSVNAVTDVVNIHNATILNGDKDDFSPIAFENGLLFCSNSKKVSKSTDKATIVDDLNLKFAVIDSLGNLTKPTAFARKTNSKTHEGPSCFSANGDTMFLTRVMSKGGIAKTNKEGETTLKIYIKTRDAEGNFNGDAIMPFESETYSYCHPTLSADGQRLYFASNMPGGFGKMDLWMTRKLKSGGWSQAMNLGSRINSAGNELFPHITSTGSFYFSSDGRKGGKGGNDIYTVDIENKIAQAAALGSAFNTEGDDFGIMFLPTNEKKGYFSSNRKGGSGGDDIYEFEFK
jgi:WD40-like Beta Propeller Repeat